MSDEKPEPKIMVHEHPNGHRMVTVEGNLHSIDDEPACVYADGTRWWYRDGRLHRDDNLPAVIWHTGVQEWWVNGVRHRELGPAVVYGDDPLVDVEWRGVSQYWVNGVLAREDLPPPVARYRAELAALRKKHFGG